jgi:5-methylcytosine-specific restriction protein B
MSFYKQLRQFLEQSKTDNLKTKHYNSKYRGLDVKVSFGQGNTARIPWISFLKKPNKTSKGIYPVYLFYKDFDKLILAYGVSETNTPDQIWDIKGKQTIRKYFEEQFHVRPGRYGDSYIFKVYDMDDLPDGDKIDRDLNEIISEYFENSTIQKPMVNRLSSSEFVLTTLYNELNNAGLSYSPNLLVRFTASLITKPFVILTGLSGSGKTKLAQAFVHWICQEDNQYCIVPVGADWTNREPLLGYPNALKPDEYVKPDNGALDLIIQANKRHHLPHFLILDEMNLSHVERYFADFLSVMESKEEIPLFTEEIVDNGVPPSLSVPENLFIIGTVNIDETTNMFSPKVLDRANTIEFRITREEMESFLDSVKEVNMDVLTGKGGGMAKSFLDMAANKSFATEDIDVINEVLVRFFEELKKSGAEFGYRSASEILRLIHQLSVLDASLTTNHKVDIAIMQKLLPKLHGSRRKLCPVLETLGSFCITGDVKIIKDVFETSEFDFNGANVLYPLSLEKISRMYRGAIDNGFASFAEA